MQVTVSVCCCDVACCGAGAWLVCWMSQCRQLYCPDIWRVLGLDESLDQCTQADECGHDADGQRLKKMQIYAKSCMKQYAIGMLDINRC